MARDRKRILFISFKKPNYLYGNLYEGLQFLGHLVYEFPPKPTCYSTPNALSSDDNLHCLEDHTANGRLTEGRVISLLRQDFFDLVISPQRSFDPYASRHPFKRIEHFYKYNLTERRKRLSGNYLLLLRKYIKAPIVVVDGSDENYVQPHDLALLKMCALYFKRELQFDEYKSLKLLSDSHLVSPNELENLAKKFRPISIGIDLRRFRSRWGSEPRSLNKEYDVFWAGRATSSRMRSKVFSLLNSVKDKFKLKLYHDSSLPLPCFYDEISTSNIGLSIEGNGWDCFRHYEIPACGTALFCGWPTIQTKNFFEHGKSAIFFRNDLSDFVELLSHYLSNKELLQKVAMEGEKHLARHLTCESIAEYLINELDNLIPREPISKQIMKPTLL